MTLFLTSSPGGFGPAPCPLDERNRFVDRLKSVWPQRAKVLFITAFPDNPEGNDIFSGTLFQAFALSGLPISKMDICDDRNPACDLSSYDGVILSGGHVPTQNAFFHRIGLKDAIRNFHGIVIGISAGTMNFASTVYAQPEEPGEAIDPDYQRFLPGLGLMDLMILPHFQSIRNEAVDGMHITNDLLLPDSMGKKIYALCDGSYVFSDGRETKIYGECYLAENGVLSLFCEDGQAVATT